MRPKVEQSITRHCCTNASVNYTDSLKRHFCRVFTKLASARHMAGGYSFSIAVAQWPSVLRPIAAVRGGSGVKWWSRSSFIMSGRCTTNSLVGLGVGAPSRLCEKAKESAPGSSRIQCMMHKRQIDGMGSSSCRKIRALDEAEGADQRKPDEHLQREAQKMRLSQTQGAQSPNFLQ